MLTEEYLREFPVYFNSFFPGVQKLTSSSLIKTFAGSKIKLRFMWLEYTRAHPGNVHSRTMSRQATFPEGKDRFDPGIFWTCADVSTWPLIIHAIHINAACPVPPSLYMKHRWNTEYLNVLLPSCNSLALIAMTLLLQQSHAATCTFVHTKLEINDLISELHE